jgi:hypothetical protein
MLASALLVLTGAAQVAAQPADQDGRIAYLPLAARNAALPAERVQPRPTVAPTATAPTAPTVEPTVAPPPATATQPTPPKPDESTLSGCGAASFIDVSTYDQVQGYPEPELEAECTATELVVRSNGIPNFEFVRITPNDLQAQDYTWRMPITPTVLAEPVDIPLLGPVAIAVNGLPIYGPNEAPTHGTADPVLDEILDFCSGHTAQRGDYHFHARPDCLFEDSEGKVSLVIGYAFDGYPIVAPWTCVDGDCTRTRKLQSSWQRTQDLRNAWDAHEYVEGSGDLDRCNGILAQEGSYRYVASDTFPYLLGCYRGEATANGAGGGGGAGGGRPGPPPRPWSLPLSLLGIGSAGDQG